MIIENLYTALPIADRKSRLRTSIRSNSKDFVQQDYDSIYMNRGPVGIPFPVDDGISLIKQHNNTHKHRMKDSENMLEAALPNTFSEKMKWTTFLWYLRYYVCH